MRTLDELINECIIIRKAEVLVKNEDTTPEKRNELQTQILTILQEFEQKGEVEQVAMMRDVNGHNVFDILGVSSAATYEAKYFGDELVATKQK